MTISDASEIQFWPVGETSFNLETEGYTDDYCFHQKFLCTGQRRFQGVDADGIQRDYWLLGFDEDGDEVFNEQFEIDQESEDAFENLPFVDWVNVPSGDGFPWTIDSTPSVTVSSGGFNTSDRLSTPIEDIIAGTYTINYDLTISGSTTSIVLDFRKSGISVGNATLSLASGSHVGSTSITLTDSPDEFRVYFSKLLTGSRTLTLNNPFSMNIGTGPVKYSLAMTPSDESMCDKKIQFKIYTGTDETDGELDITDEDSEELFYSDFVDFVSTWANGPDSGRVDIQYRSIQNFAGLLYDSESPYFQIQLEGRFRKERKITEEKSLELTEMVLNTAASVKKQRKLTIDDVPDYMHTKICLILAHAASGSVLVNGMEISKEEAYEEGERPESYPLTPAEIWLTDKNYYKHNVI